MTYQALTAKYLTFEDKGIFADEDKRKVYAALRRLDAAKLTIFLLYVELENKTEVARRLGAHRNTVSMIIERIRKEVRR